MLITFRQFYDNFVRYAGCNTVRSIVDCIITLTQSKVLAVDLIYTNCRIVIALHSDVMLSGMQEAFRRHNIPTHVLANPTAVAAQAMDVLYLDDGLPHNSNRAELCQLVTHLSQDAFVVIMSHTCEAVWIRDLLDAGASGFLHINDKLFDRLVTITEDIILGATYVSPSAQRELRRIEQLQSEIVAQLSVQQRRLLHLMVQGHDTASIARMLNKKKNSIHQAQHKLRQRFNVKNNRQLIRLLAANDGDHLPGSQATHFSDKEA